jgi:hypothetical protein
MNAAYASLALPSICINIVDGQVKIISQPQNNNNVVKTNLFLDSIRQTISIKINEKNTAKNERIIICCTK